MDILTTLTSASFLAAILRVATPYVCAALGGVLAERVGIPNIALEGQMLAAACVGVLVAGYSGSVWLGAACGIVAGAVLALLLTAFCIELEADPIIVGIGINILAAGGTTYAIFTLLDDKGGTTGLDSGRLPTVDLPVVEHIPYLGAVLSGQSIVTYTALAMVIATTWLLYRTKFGYHLRAIGERPDAAATVGIRLRRVSYSTMAFSGALAGLGGVFLSMAAVSFFIRDMTAGRGFIALAAVFLGGIRPIGAFIAAVGFGAAEAMAIQLGNNDIPQELVTAIPYALTLIALGVFTAGRMRRERGPRTRPQARLASIKQVP